VPKTQACCPRADLGGTRFRPPAHAARPPIRTQEHPKFFCASSGHYGQATIIIHGTDFYETQPGGRFARWDSGSAPHRRHPSEENTPNERLDLLQYTRNSRVTGAAAGDIDIMSMPAARQLETGFSRASGADRARKAIYSGSHLGTLNCKSNLATISQRKWQHMRRVELDQRRGNRGFVALLLLPFGKFHLHNRKIIRQWPNGSGAAPSSVGDETVQTSPPLDGTRRKKGLPMSARDRQLWARYRARGSLLCSLPPMKHSLSRQSPRLPGFVGTAQAELDSPSNQEGHPEVSGGLQARRVKDFLARK